MVNSGKNIKPIKGYALMTILKPQPDGSAGKWASDKSLGKQVKFAIQDIETNRQFDEVNIT